MPLIIQRASAGSGKTEQLARRYLQILLTASYQEISLDPSKVLAVTFTRKAAGEMLTRVFKVLATASLDSKKRQDIVEGTGLPIPTQEQCLLLLRRLVERIDGLSIETIDALFAKQAHSFALDLGIVPSWKVADRHTRRLLATETVLRLIEQDPHFSKEWSTLHHFTRRISFLEEAAHLLEKNRFLVNSLRNSAGAANSCVTPCSSSPAANAARGLQTGPHLLAQQDRERLLAFLESFVPPLTARGKPNVQWQKALCYLKEACTKPLFLKDLWTLSSLMKRCLEQEPSFYGKPIPSEFLKEMTPLIKASAQEQQRLAFLREEALQRLSERYHQLRKELSFEAAAYTFEEIQAIVTETLPRVFDSDLAQRLESKVEHLLFDEYQDTSQRQHNFFSFLIEEVLAKGGTTFVVGDVKQGIYGWRGGKRYLLHGLEKKYAAYLSPAPSLEESYRSSQAILDAVNEVFSALDSKEALLKMEGDDSFKKAARYWKLDFKPHQRASSLPALQGRVLLHEVAVSPEDPYESMIQKVIHLVEAHRKEDVEREVAILVRRTKFIPPLLSSLRSRGILASGEGGNPLADTLAVEVLLSLLLWIDHPNHTAAREHVAFSPLAPLLKESALALRKKIITQGLPKMLYHWSTLPSFYESCSSYERERVGQLVAMAHHFEKTKTLSEFVEHARLERVESPLNQGVRVLSIHASKGLEFESVILMDLDTNIFSGAHERLRVHQDNKGGFFIHGSQEIMALQGRKELLEELHQEQWAEALSLLYVGMTRAISYLDLVILPSPHSSKKSMAQWLRSVDLKAHWAEGKSLRDQKEKKQPLQITSVIESSPTSLAPIFYTAHSEATEKADGTKNLSLTQYPSALAKLQTERDEISGLGRTSMLRFPRVLMRSPIQETTLQGAPLSQQFYDKTSRKEGILKHALLAEIEWLDQKLPSAESWTHLLLDRFPFQKTFEVAKDLLERFENDEALKSVFERATFLKNDFQKEVSLEVWRERTFAVFLPEKRELLNGIFDRVILKRTREGIFGTIIDFKPTPLFEKEREKRLFLYQPQLNAYKEALRQLVPGLATVETKIAWI